MLICGVSWQAAGQCMRARVPPPNYGKRTFNGNLRVDIAGRAADDSERVVGVQ